MTNWAFPINALEFQLRKATEQCTESGEALARAQKLHDERVERRDAHAAALRTLKAAAEAEGRGVEYSPADGQQEARKPTRFRVGQKVRYSRRGEVGTVFEIDPASSVKDGSWYSVMFSDDRELTIPRDELTLWDPPRNSAGVPLIVGNTYQLHRPTNLAQHNRMVKLRERITGSENEWHVEFTDTNTDGSALSSELK